MIPDDVVLTFEDSRSVNISLMAMYKSWTEAGMSEPALADMLRIFQSQVESLIELLACQEGVDLDKAIPDIGAPVAA